MTYTHILVDEPRPRIRRITLNRPEKRNALNNLLRKEIFEALEAADRDPDISVMIVRGAGSSFSSGYDSLPTMRSSSPIILPAGPANGRGMSPRAGSRSGISPSR